MNTISGVVDRIEGKTAVIVTEDKNVINIPLSCTDDIGEGDYVTLIPSDNGFKIVTDKKVSEEKRSLARTRMDEIISKNKKSFWKQIIKFSI